MKRIFFFAAAALIASSAAMAQKAKVSEAEKQLNYSIIKKGDAASLSTAKPLIDDAMLDSKTSLDPKTFFVAAQIYSGLAVCQKQTDGMEKAKQFISKAIEMDEKGDAKGKNIGKNAKKIQSALVQLSQDAQFLAYTANDQKNYKLAEQSFIDEMWFNSKTENYTEAKDSVTLFNIGIMAQNAEDWSVMAESFEKAAKYNYGGENSYIGAFGGYLKNNENGRAESIIKEGIERYPESKTLIGNFISYSLQNNKADEALAYMNKKIEMSPSNPQYYFARGLFLYSTDKKTDGIEDFKKALEIDPTYYQAAYNAAWSYYEIADAQKKEAADSWKDQKKADALEAQSVVNYKSAIEYFLKAEKLTTDKQQLLSIYEALKTSYYKTGDFEKNSQMTQKIKELQ